MLKESEKRGMGELLERMDPNDLDSLVQTVTNKLLIPQSREDAIQAVILHTDSALDLLKRRKVRKELLFKYLHDKKVPIEVIAEKTTLVKKVLEVWGSSDDVDMFICDENSLDAPPPAPVPSRNASHTSLCSLDSLPSGILPTNYFSNLRRTESNLSMMNYDESSNSSFTQLSSAHSNSVPIQQDSFTSSLQINNIASSSCSNNTSHNSVMFPVTQSQCQDMAKNFVEWFYKILNTCSHNPEPSSDFNQSMFWPDANAKVNLLGVTGESVESFQVQENSTEVCDMLRNVVNRHSLTFNPNLCEEGVRGTLDPHGLVLVLACGTLHNQHTVCGVFEQIFGLIRDPNAENNWKIKNTEARLFARKVNEKPILANSSLCAIAYS